MSEPIAPETQARGELIAFLRSVPSAREALINMGDPISTESTSPWQHAAAQELRRKLAVMMGGFSLNLLNLLQLGVIDARAVAEAAHAASDDPMAASSPTSGSVSPLIAWADAPVDVRESLARLAQELLGVPTLGLRNWDSLDFHSIGVACLRNALLAAYIAGQEARPAGS